MFGGTFDPPHLGHLVAAQEAAEVLSLDRVLFIPARQSPHRMDEEASPASLRLSMVRAAIAGHDRFEVEDLELGREGPSYSVDTLEELARRDESSERFLILGADQWARFGSWHRPREVARLARLALLTREGDRPSAMDPGFEDGPAPGFVEVPMIRLDISGTLVRARVRGRRSIRFLVPEAVCRIIEVENLYLRETRSPGE